MDLIDFSNCLLSNRYYGGSERKIGIIYENDYYILKFRKIVDDNVRFSIESEYLGSHIFDLLKVPVHRTLLGIYKGQEVVALKDFTLNNKLVEYNSVGASTVESTKNVQQHVYTYKEIIRMIKQNGKSIDTKLVEDRFWKMFVVDALLGNFDRHGYNWGYLKDLKTGKMSLAPVYDNGSCLFPNLPDADINKVLTSKEEMDKRTYTFPTSQIKLRGKKSSYYEVIKSKEFQQCTDACQWLMSTIDFTEINKLIDSLPTVSLMRKTFYKEIIGYRYEKIFKANFENTRVAKGVVKGWK